MSKIKWLLLFLVVLMFTGCSVSSKEIWGGRSQIKLSDVKQILIENSEGVSVYITDQNKISAFISALKNSKFDPAVFDINAADFIATIELNSGEERKIDLWLGSGANLFTDSDDDGHFTLTEDARTSLVEIIKETDIWNVEE